MWAPVLATLLTQDHWSLRPIRKPDLPAVRDARWVRTPIDRFVLAALEARGLAPSPEADRRTLLRRVSFDLTGLPPEETDGDYEAAVDRLLASPRYGERWGRHWLDVAHYADTHGFDKDKPRPNAWPYRDWVIRSLNDDLPYARFVTAQLAGDALDPPAPVATGFIAAGPWDFVGHVEVRNGTAEKERVRNLDRDDMVATTMNVFVSLTAQCARCHDHKFDPIASEEYYSLQAVFAGVDRAERGEPRPPEYGYHSAIEPRADISKWVQVDLGEPTPLDRVALFACDDDFNGIGAGFGFPPAYRIEVSDDPAFAAPQAMAAGRTARYVRVTATRLALRKDDYIFALAELQAWTPDGRNAALGKTVTALDSIEAPVRWRRTNLVDGLYVGAPTVFAAATRFRPEGQFVPTGGKPRPIHVLARGEVTRPGREVAPGTVRCLGVPFELKDPADEAQRRLALARWIVDPRNPLAWRSIVNRLWHHHFGRGIVDTPNDFGKMGGAPTHPELLDFLAAEFRDGPQSLKALHRLIVTSATYRQASAHDAARAARDGDNRFLWRMNRRRLEGEAIRDAVLSVAGKLDLTMGGPGFRPFGFKDDHSPHYRYGEHDPDDAASHRRTVYQFSVRSVPDPFLATLDCPDPSMSVDRRNETLTALQALALLNNRFMVRMAEHFAARAGDVETACRLALGRAPTPEEAETLGKLGLPAVCRLLFNTNEFVFVD